MKTIKGWITTTFLAATMMVASMNVNAGIIFGGGNLADSTKAPCTATETQKISTSTSDDLVGIIFGGFVGIIFGGGSLTQQAEDCGIIFGGN
jgi:hypothetical protein